MSICKSSTLCAFTVLLAFSILAFLFAGLPNVNARSAPASDSEKSEAAIHVGLGAGDTEFQKRYGEPTLSSNREGDRHSVGFIPAWRLSFLSPTGRRFLR